MKPCRASSSFPIMWVPAVTHTASLFPSSTSIIAAVAFVLGAIAFMIGPNWTLLWVATVLLVLALVTGSVLRRMGFGQA